jgi:hypothetical protein
MTNRPDNPISGNVHETPYAGAPGIVIGYPGIVDWEDRTTEMLAMPWELPSLGVKSDFLAVTTRFVVCGVRRAARPHTSKRL